MTGTLNLDDLSRIILAVMCSLSAVASIVLGFATHPRYTPHMALIAFWSLWGAAAMTDLAFDVVGLPFLPDRLLVINLNGSFTVVVGGWTLFSIRLLAHARRQQQVLGNIEAALNSKLKRAGEAGNK